VNKADNERRRQEAVDFYSLGFESLYPISAIHGIGVADLLDDVVDDLPSPTPEPEFERVRISIVGRPNVGKSSLLNKILGEERVIVSPVAGTTRDAVDTHLEWEETPITLIDTAGIRKRGKIERGVEHYSVLRALRAIKRSDVALLMIDGFEGITAQDKHVASMILDESASVVVLVNKWDKVEKDAYTVVEYTKWVRYSLRFMDYVPVLYISALTGQRVHEVIPQALSVHEARFRRIATSQFNKLIQEAVAKHAPPSRRGRRLKIYYASQPGVDPPTFVFHVNDPELVHFSYERYLENQIRKAFPFPGTPLRLVFQPRKRRDAGR